MQLRRASRSAWVALLLLLGCACSSEATKKPSRESDESSDEESSPKKQKKPKKAKADASASAAPTAEATATAAPAPTAPAWPPPGTVAIAGGTIQAHDLNDHLFPVTVEPFAIDVHEVTVKEYRACVAAEKCRALDDISLNKGGCNYPRTDREDHPINCAYLDDATKYCASVGKRVPSAAEWQFAASAGGTRAFPWGDTSPTKDTMCWRSTDATCPVGTHPQGNTPDGIQDLGGNVAEDVLDVGCLGTPPAGTKCLQPFGQIQGGAWNTFESDGVKASNLNQTIGKPPESIGFRCVAPKSDEPPQLLP